MLLGLPRTYWILWVGALVNRLGGFVFSFLALYLTDARHFSPVEAGTAVSLFGIGSFAAAGFGGWLADAKGRRFGILFGTLTGATMVLVLGHVEALYAIFAAALLTGFFGDSYRAALNAAVADVVEPAERARAYSIFYWAVNLGFAVAASSAGWLARRGYEWLFIIDAATTLVFATIVFSLVPETRPERPKELGDATLAWWKPFRDARFLPFAVAQLVVIVVFMQGQVSLPLAMRAHGIDAGDYGSLIAANGFLILVLQPLAAPLVRRASFAKLLAFGALLTGLGFGMNAFAATKLEYLGGIVLWTLGEIGFSAASPAFIASIAPVHARGVYQGALHMLWGAAFAVAPLVGTFVIQAASADVLWLACAIACAAAAAVHARLPTENSSGAPVSTTLEA